MALYLTNISGTANQYIDVVMPAGVAAHTMNCWVYPISITQAAQILTLRSASTVNYVQLGLDGQTNKAFLATNGSSYSTYHESTNTFTANAWNMVTCSIAGTNSRKVYLNGTPTLNEDTQTGLTLNRLLIGATFLDNITTPTWNGYIAEVGVWNVSMTDAEVSSLYAGTKAKLVRPLALRQSIPLIIDPNSEKAVTSITTNGTVTYVNHVRRYG